MSVNALLPNNEHIRIICVHYDDHWQVDNHRLQSMEDIEEERDDLSLKYSLSANVERDTNCQVRYLHINPHTFLHRFYEKLNDSFIIDKNFIGKYENTINQC